ncbi:MAG: aminoglycoside phosphotransferase family protein [Chloroflexota bacterium]
MNKEKLVEIINQNFNFQVQSFRQLSLGADADSAVFRAASADGKNYFVKLRTANFEPTSVSLQAALSAAGTEQVISPVATVDEKIWLETSFGHLMVFPFVTGNDGYEQAIQPEKMIEFGQVIRQVHAAEIPSLVRDALPRERFDPSARLALFSRLRVVGGVAFNEPIAIDTKKLLIEKETEIRELIKRAEGLAEKVKAKNLPFVVCHADLHAGNLLFLSNGELRIVDWDTAILAPAEKDLMYPGGALLASDMSPAEEERLFFEAYGSFNVDAEAIMYFRCERIIQDIFEYCRELLDSTEGTLEERQQSLMYLKSNFEPGRTIDAAYRTGE